MDDDYYMPQPGDFFQVEGKDGIYIRREVTAYKASMMNDLHCVQLGRGWGFSCKFSKKDQTFTRCDNKDLLAILGIGDHVKSLLNMAFAYGFYITREGYNCETPCDHLAPDRLHENHKRFGNLLELIVEMEKDTSFRKLRQEAMEELGL